jgi:hypothetical protein
METIDAICILLGVLNGAFLAAVPDSTKKNPSLCPIFAFGAALAFGLLFLAVDSLRPTFLATTAMTLLMALIGFFSMRPVFAQMPSSQSKSQQFNASGEAPSRA